MPYTRRQVRFLESSGSPLTPAQKDKMNAELHTDPSLGHKRKGSKAMKRSPRKPKPEGETHAYDWRDHAGRNHDGKFSKE
jgi:hypothetical protein